MTDEEYLDTLDAFEGKGDKTGVPTSDFYGITSEGINTVSNTIRRKETNGEYTANAKQTRAILGKQLLKTLEDNIVWDAKEKKMTKWATIDQLKKYGQKGWGEIALAIRDINSRKIDSLRAKPLTDVTKEGICLTAHNRPIVLTEESFRNIIKDAPEYEIRHKMMTDTKDVRGQNVIDGIRRRLASCFNLESDTVKPKDAWIQYDKNGPAGINELVNISYDRVINDYQRRKNDEDLRQAIDSKSELNQPDQQEQQTNVQNQPKNQSFLQRLGEIGMAAINPLYGMVRKSMENQLANSQENMLNSKEEQNNEAGNQNNNLQ